MASGRVGYVSLLFSLLAIRALVSGTSSGTYQMEPHESISREKELIRDLMENYKKFGKNGRPVSNTSESILVEFGLTLVQIVSLDEKDQLLTTSVWYNYKWQDVLLKWNPAKYDNISEVRVPSEDIWRPDVVLYNFADTRLQEQREALVVLNHTGHTLWMPQAILKSTCPIDITYFPFDEQTCNLKFGSWTYNGFKLDMNFLDEEKFGMSVYLESNEWAIILNKAEKRVLKYDCCPEPYIDLYYTLKIKRRVAFYSSILILPCALLSLLTLIIFWVPPESPAKLQLGMNIFVAFFVLLLLLSDSTPRATSSIPLIGAYYCLNMLMITVSTFVSCIVANMFFRGVRKNRAPKWLRSLMIDGVATVLMLRTDLLERDDEGNLRKWNGKITGEPKRKFPGTDIKYAKVRLLDTPNGREIGQKLSMAHEIIEYQHMREREHIRHMEGDPLRAEMLEEVRSIREMVERVRDQKLRREDNDKFIREWRVIACITDRFFFVIYVIVNAVSLIVIFFTKNP